LDLVESITLSSRIEVDSKLLFSGTEWKIFDEQTEVHDGFLVLEVAHLEFLNSLGLLFGLSHI